MKQIISFVRSYLKIQEAKDENTDEAKMKELNDDHTWKETQCFAFGYNVASVDKEAKEIQSDIKEISNLAIATINNCLAPSSNSAILMGEG
ncbi:unnamed protein product, partial [Adineta steineri]